MTGLRDFIDRCKFKDGHSGKEKRYASTLCKDLDSESGLPRVWSPCEIGEVVVKGVTRTRLLHLCCCNLQSTSRCCPSTSHISPYNALHLSNENCSGELQLLHFPEMIEWEIHQERTVWIGVFGTSDGVGSIWTPVAKEKVFFSLFIVSVIQARNPGAGRTSILRCVPQEPPIPIIFHFHQEPPLVTLQ